MFLLAVRREKSQLCFLVKAFLTTTFFSFYFNKIWGYNRKEKGWAENPGNSFLRMWFLFYSFTLRYKLPTPKNGIIGKISQRS